MQKFHNPLDLTPIMVRTILDAERYVIPFTRILLYKIRRGVHGGTAKALEGRDLIEFSPRLSRMILTPGGTRERRRIMDLLEIKEPK